MKPIYAARFAGVTGLAAGLYPFLEWQLFHLQHLVPPETTTPFSQLLPQLALGGWLSLLAIFAWMTLLVTLMYSYSPIHRVTTTMQSGLTLISAVLLILGVLLVMNRLELAVAYEGNSSSAAPIGLTLASVEQIAIALLEAGLLMGGGVMAWISFDLVLLGKLPALWMAPGIFAGLALVPAPILGLSSWQLLIALAGFFLFCLVLGARRTLPESYPPLG